MEPSVFPPEAAEPALHMADSAATVPAVANPSLNLPPIHNHPPYAEMITAAISALKEREGSSRTAITKYIETQYSDLPANHLALLTHHLKQLKKSGHLVMEKRSYMLPLFSDSSFPQAAANDNIEVGESDSSFGAGKRGPGRPPKPKPSPMPLSQPNTVAPLDSEVMGTEPMLVSLGLVDAPVKRSRGRPPKLKVVRKEMMGGELMAVNKRGRGRPPKLKFGFVEQGQPQESGVAIYGNAALSGGTKPPGRSRGRPKKNVQTAVAADGYGTTLISDSGGDNITGGVMEGGDVGVLHANGGSNTSGGVADVVVTLSAKQRGRPPKLDGLKRHGRLPNAVGPKKPRKLSGKPLGRPRKNASIKETQALDLQALDQQPSMEYQDLKSKLELFRLKVKQAITAVKPYLNPESAVTALLALQELEDIATADVNAPLYGQDQEILL